MELAIHVMLIVASLAPIAMPKSPTACEAASVNALNIALKFMDEASEQKLDLSYIAGCGYDNPFAATYGENAFQRISGAGGLRELSACVLGMASSREKNDEAVLKKKKAARDISENIRRAMLICGVENE